MQLFVGLGNPGPRYAETPHNAGFVVIDRFRERHRFAKTSAKYQGEFVRGQALGHDVGLLKPQTYMNLSGASVAAALRYLPIEPTDILVVFDEMDIPSGKLRLRKSGGHGGHNGLRSIIESIGSSDFPRIRVGVGRPPEGRGATGHLLGRAGDSQAARLSATIDLAVDALDVVLTKGFEAAMNRFNGLEPLGTPSEP